MTVIKLFNKDPNEVMEIVRAMRDSGMVQGKDFDFAYYQSTWDGMIGEIPKNVEFKFYKEKLATWFALRYGS
jgi:hypothetical protein